MGYENGKIYAIRSHQTDDIYIGSTTQPLYKRLSSHKANFKDKSYRYVSSNELLKYDDVYIELLQGYCCDNKMELLKREGEFIRSMDCVNKRVAGRTKQEYLEDTKEYRKKWGEEYYEINKDKIKIKKREYYEANQDKIKEYNKENKEKMKIKNKEYREANQDKIKEYNKEYREANKDKLKEYRENNKDKIKEWYETNKEKNHKKYDCECGGKYTHQTKSQHFKTQKHIIHFQ